MELLNFIKDLIVSGWSMIWPFYIMDEYNRGLVLRWGKYKRFIEPGLGMKWPIAEELFTASIATETISTTAQSLTTKDGVSISISLVVKYNVGDDEESLKKYLLKVRDVNDAIDDIAMGKAKMIVMQNTWEECKTNDLDNAITIKTRAEAKKWGINIDYVVLVELAESFNLRLMQ